MSESRCGLCGIPVEAKEFKAHTESFEHKAKLCMMLDYYVKIQTIAKERPDEIQGIIQGIKEGKIHDI